MTLASQFEQQLKQFPSGAAATTVTVDESPRQLTCEIVACDSLAVSFDRLRLATAELAGSSAADLERIGLTTVS